MAREAKVRCFVCLNNVPVSRAEPIKMSPWIVKQACKEHGLESPYHGEMTGDGYEGYVCAAPRVPASDETH